MSSQNKGDIVPHTKNPNTAKQLIKLIENSSGLKIHSLSDKLTLKSKKPICADYCSNGRNCSVDFSEIKSWLKPPRQFYIHTCESNYVAVFIPFYLGSNLTNLLLMGCDNKNDLNIKRIVATARLVSETLGYLYRQEITIPKKNFSKPSSHRQEIVEKVISYIKENYYRNDLSLKKIAEENNVSYYYLSHIFKKCLDVGLISYLAMIRVEKASKLLKNLKLNISQVSYAVGYSDPGYFFKVFKGYTGYSPAEFRKRVYATCVDDNGKKRKAPYSKYEIIIKKS